ncbi:MAG TPA: aminopeptidase P family protein [Oceanospirillaceae bacterium]|nr:aminopeptidase P family protein [Oceanospirillaceae bacterium]
MLAEAQSRTAVLQSQMQNQNIPFGVFTDESSIAYLAGFWGYLGIEFGRPTMLVVPAVGSPTVITPLMESEMVDAMTWVEDIRVWEDFGSNSWQAALAKVLGNSSGKRPESIWLELPTVPAIVRNYLDQEFGGVPLCDIAPVLGQQRMIKSALEIEVMSQAGSIAGAMMHAAHESLAEGVPEYESALAVINAGTKKAAGFLTDTGWERFVSPMIHNLQILQSGRDTSMVHRRASVRTYQRADPVYFCFCNMAQFKQYKLGFDRMFHIGEVTDQAAQVQMAAIEAQQAAIAAIKPGVTAEQVAAAANAVYQQRGYETGYRTGRSIGVAYLEVPELKHGDTTVLQAGMTFAVDGGISIDGVTAGRIGDSIVVTESGCDYLTQYPRQLLVTNN